MRLRGLRPQELTGWLARNVAELRPPVDFELISGGRSNLTYRATDAAGRTWALRRPPIGGVLSTAHDMGREWRFISALHPAGIPVPEPVAHCADTDVIGAEFYVMGHVDGTVLGDPESARDFPHVARHRAGMATAEGMAALHAVDPDAVGLGDIARRDGYVQRKLRRWQRQVHQSGAPDLPLLDAVHDALLDGVPEQTSGIVHGDFRPGNLSYDDSGEVLAVFDWELATLGEPLADLGWLVSTWQEPGEPSTSTAVSPSSEPGFATRDELVAHYARLAGRDVSDLPYYVAFQQWRGACIGAGVRARYQAGVMGDDGYDAGARAETELRQAQQAWESVRELGLAG